jgi:ketosteroid isomerase-like protein
MEAWEHKEENMELAVSEANRTEETEILGLFERYVVAWRAADLTALSDIYANDEKVTAIWPDPSFSYPLRGWQTIHKGLRNVFRRCRGMDIEYSNHVVHLSDVTAILTATWDWMDLVRPAKPGAAVAGNMARTCLVKGAGTFVFERRGPSWVLIHEHSAGLMGGSAPKSN